MLFRRFNTTRLLAILFVIAVCAIVLPAIAYADANVVVTANDQNPTCTGVQASYKFDIQNFNVNTTCFANSPGTVVVDFGNPGIGNLNGTPPSGVGDPTPGPYSQYNLACAVGRSVPVEFYVVPFSGTAQWVNFQPTPVIDNVARTATFFIPSFNVGNGVVTRVRIGDRNQDLCAVNPCQHGNYNINITFNWSCLQNTQYSGAIMVNQACSTANWSIVGATTTGQGTTLTGYVYACCNMTVKGTVYDCAGIGVAGATVSLTIPGSSGGNPPADVTYTTTADANGNFLFKNEGTPQCAGTSVITLGVQNANCAPCSWTQNIIVMGRSPIAITIDNLANPVYCHRCNEICVTLRDQCCPPLGNPAISSVDRVVYLSAFSTDPLDPTKPLVCAHFYNTCIDCTTGGTTPNRGPQVNYVVIPAGSSQACLYFVPLVSGTFTITATPFPLSVIPPGENGTPLPAVSVQVTPICPAAATLTLCPQVTDKNGNPRTNWPVVAAITLGSGLAADEIYNVQFTVTTATGAPVPFGYASAMGPANLEYGGAHYTLVPPCVLPNTATFAQCALKQYYYIVPDVPKDANGNLTITGPLTVTGYLYGTVDTTEIIPAGPATVGPFVTDAELVRTLACDRWQALSSPKVLAKCGVPYNGEDTSTWGTFADLGVPAGSIILGYVAPGGWASFSLTDYVNPTVAYFIRTPQCGTITPFGPPGYVLDYVFARASIPGDAAPRSGIVVTGMWNAVGIGVDTNQPDITMESNLIYRAMSPALMDYLMTLWNQGPNIGNVNTLWTSLSVGPNTLGSYATDSGKSMYNGDVYWVLTPQTPGFLNTQYGVVGQDMIQCYGVNSLGT